MTAIVASAFLLGVLHAAGPDHLVAVTTLAAERGPRRAAWIGCLWGLGHAAGATILSSLVFFGARHWFVAAGAAMSERAVGVVMILLGVRTLYPLVARRALPSEHEHGGVRHSHFSSGSHRHDHGAGAASGFGVLHGLSGGPHLLAAAPVALLSAHDAVLYLAAFSTGTLAAMTILAYGWGAWTSGRSGISTIALRWNMGAASLLLGLWWLVA